MLSLVSGKPIAYIKGGPLNKKFIYIKNEDDTEDSDDIKDKGMRIKHGTFTPVLKQHERTVAYIAGPSGSGKTTAAISLIRDYLNKYPDELFFLFSRTDYKNDPAFKGLHPKQVTIDESLIQDPIDVTEELEGGSIILFDDCNTIQNDKLKHIVDKLMADIMEVGRKLDATIIITNHLVIPNEKKIARTIMNELQTLTVFPKSGSSQQIRYALKNYFGLNNKQVDEIVTLPSK